MEVITKTTEETQRLADELAKILKPKDVLALYGDLGAGKTTFTNFLVKALGINARVQSPTFVLARKYKDKSTTQKDIKVVNHIDLYRLKSLEEALEIGLAETLEEENSISVIEWPELAESILPVNTIKIYFEYIGEHERKICIKSL